MQMFLDNKPAMKNLSKFQSKNTQALIAGVITACALATAYLIYRRKANRMPRKAIINEDKPLKQDSLNMERYVFNLAEDSGTVQAVVEQAGECYSVHLNGKYAGSMWQDEHKGGQWNTQDVRLEPYLWEISKYLSEAFSKKGFPSLLMGTYPEIIAANWKSSETLEVILKTETDIEVFGTFLKDEVLNLVTFEEHLDLMVRKENDAYFIIVGIN